ncbi:MAG: RnfABCDGE type electron transport complex subunit C, partial [Oscillospiraceae bacterium]|nr:RnfABCDGE type electron transport complex subunit C [Oscillospiraceae bacterium]
SGAAGLGGAGFPTVAKLSVEAIHKIEYIIINGAECEPYITSDTRAMVDRTEDVFAGAVYLKEYLKPKQVVLCVEDINKESIEKLSALCAGVAGIDVRVLPSKYPQGERKVLVYNVTGRVVPEGGRLTDVGCIVINCTTVAVFATYMRTGKPLVRRCVTVDGSAVKNPQNVLAPIGTPLRDLFAACGGLKDDVKKVLLGGPMMGAAVPSLDVPMVKITNAVLAFTEKDAFVPAPTACIKCGRCLSNCPMSLMPSYIEDAFERGNVELLKQYKVNLCAECGCCAYICPSKRPLSQVMTLSKNILWEAKQ